MAEYSISEGEWEGHPVFDITARCGHSFQVFRYGWGSIADFLKPYGNQEKCPECLTQDFRDLSDEIDYRTNPDTEALGLTRFSDATTVFTKEVTEATEDFQDC